MKNLLLILLILLASVACDRAAHTTQLGNTAQAQTAPVATSASMDAGAITEAFGAQRNVPQVQGSGIVVKVLKDDTKGLQHQKFLLKVSDNITILIAHNIDLAPRVADIKEGDMVAFKGEYIYTPKGGTVHWTHKDPRGNHQAGWLKRNGKVYE
jgi:Protein of unknown function (DUF3465)